MQVAERTLFLWNNEHIVSLIAQNRTVVLPIIFEALEKNIQSHWNQAVHELTVNVWMQNYLKNVRDSMQRGRLKQRI
ncbi:hypothetical protein VIGAN_03032900 [Vigna angularis var. angularis]|uniref:Uncharacterized protein n=1 Tax=Vigna angularis var. angularis TaxID=157739 RepID=A0A0S3RJI3_PHAAN|nr:hypothetical protein VIGAN_03032900 [Vigna angularis var. angularis]